MVEPLKLQDKNESTKQLSLDEFLNSPDASSRDASLEPEVSLREEKRIKRKMDIRLVVLVGFMYCVSLMDRTNLANAKQAG